jgi:hypothetical protein
MVALQELSAPYAAQTESFCQNGTATATTAAVEPRDIFIPLGSLIEISGEGAPAAAARFLAQHRSLPVAWITEGSGGIPEAVKSVRLNWEKTLFVKGGEDSSWAASTMLRAGCFPIVVYHAPYGDEKELRRFRRQAKNANALMILVREAEPCLTWPIQLRLRTQANGGLEVLGNRRFA